MRTTHLRIRKTVLNLSIAIALGALPITPALSAELNLADIPLFISNTERPNILMVLDNSNSMDEAANGAAVGSADASSKSEIARNALKDIVTNFTGQYNIGLMAYQQSAVTGRHLHNAPYDVSFDPANYDASFTGSRDSLTKRYRTDNLSSPGDFIYYNIALPFYSGGNFGSTYCYSPTADFDNGSEDPISGPWDTYRCFQTKNNPVDTLPTWGNNGSETLSGFRNYWFQSGFLPTDSDFAAGILDFGRFLTWDHVGPTWFSNSSPGRGFLHVPIEFLDSTQATLIDNKLATSQFTVNTDTPLRNAGLTPIEGTLLTAKNYFAGTALTADEGNNGSIIIPTLPESCDDDFIILVTDGLPSTNSSGGAITDTATAIAQAADVATDLHTASVDTYLLGFGLPDWVDSSLLDTIAAAGGTNHSYFANDAASIENALSGIFSNISQQVGSASAVSINSTSIKQDTQLYQARFNSGDWSGSLLSYPINSDGSLGTVISISSNIDSQDWSAGRNIITYDGSDGVAFTWATISSGQQASLNDNPETVAIDDDAEGEDRLEYLRGNDDHEGTGNNYRSRNSIVGDFVNSSPIYVASPPHGYPDNFETPSYSSFKTTYADRTPLVYIGSNAGVLHAINAANNTEKFAYVPSVLFPKLSKLTSPDYSHEFFVDGSPMAGDVFFDSAWHTMLVGGLRAGGQGYYALDITNPTTLTEAHASNIALWEFTDANDADLGYTFSQPAIGRMNNGTWVAIFGNGYNNTEADGHASTTGYAALYIVNIKTGTLIKKIEIEVGSTTTPNGLASTLPIDIDGDNDIDYIYAGDLYGNMWKFDVSANNPNSWDVADRTSGSPQNPIPIYTALDESSNPQPITSRPNAIEHPDGTGYVILFGTGKYIETTDNDPSTIPQQTFYGVWDKDTNSITSFTRSTLIEQEVSSVTTIDSIAYRITTSNTVDWTTKNGWFFDFPTTGELTISNPLIMNGRVIFVTITPTSTACAFGGESWLMEMDAATGNLLGEAPFDTNGDGVIDDTDTIVSGRKNSEITSDPTIIYGGGGGNGDSGDQMKYLSKSGGGIEGVKESSGDDSQSGRASWIQIK